MDRDTYIQLDRIEQKIDYIAQKLAEKEKTNQKAKIEEKERIRQKEAIE